MQKSKRSSIKLNVVISIAAALSIFALVIPVLL